MRLQSIGVIGAGQMGSGIAQVAAEAGLNVILYDSLKENAEKGYLAIRSRLLRKVEKEDFQHGIEKEILSRIHISPKISEAASVDVVIEAASEQLEVKKTLFRELDKLSPAHTLLATNTSSLSITELAAETTRPAKVIGMHFMNPVPVMELVEVIRGLETSDETCKTVEELAEKLGKIPVCIYDNPGFIANRLLIPMLNEAMYAVYEGVAEPSAIDLIMTLGANHPLGPLALADLIGLDTCLAIMETLHKNFGEDKYRPCPLLRKYVHAGWLGRKSGRGFYVYDK